MKRSDIIPVTNHVENVKRIVSNKCIQEESGKNQLVVPMCNVQIELGMKLHLYIE